MISLCSSCWQWLTALAPSCSNKKPDRLSVLACLNPTSVMQKCGLWCDLGILPQYLGSQSLFADTVCNPVFSLPFGSKTQDLIGCISSHKHAPRFGNESLCDLPGPLFSHQRKRVWRGCPALNFICVQYLLPNIIRHCHHM